MLPTRLLLRLVALPLALFPVLGGRAAEIDEQLPARTGLRPPERVAEPKLAPASDEPRKVMAKFRLGDGFKVDLWAAEPMLGNPVAFCLDDKGALFTAETYRYRSSVLDIRHYMFMLEDDLAARTTDNRVAFLKKNFPDEWRKLGVETEVVRRLEDSNGDGRADRSSVYAAEMNTLLDGINSGVLAHDGKLWCTNMPNLWLFSGLSADGKAEKREVLSSGYGVRFSFTGHDMHGLIIGPDGRLYFSFGDRGAHVVTKEGTTLALPDEGAVFRCELDGSHLELVHRGLRNPQELAFDDHGNLFTGDNDSDQGDRERWVYIVEGGDSGWRVGWQHNPLGKEHNPWIAERMWEPRDPKAPGVQPTYILPPILNIPDGPSGIVHYPGTGLPASFAGHFFVCGFKGSSARSAITSLKVREHGASFVVEREPAQFVGDVQATDVDFGPDSRVYFSEWGEGWEGTGRGRIFRLEHVGARQEQAAQIAEVKKLLGEGFSQRRAKELVNLLAHRDQRIRLRAQWALAKDDNNGSELLRAALRGVEGDRKELSRLHGILGLGQMARRHSHPYDESVFQTTWFEIGKALPALAKDADPEVRAQAAWLFAEIGHLEHGARLTALMEDASDRVKFFASLGVARWLPKWASSDRANAGAVENCAKQAVDAATRLARQNADRDPYLRHAAAMVLAATRDVSQLATAAADEARSVRLAALLALRHLAGTESAVQKSGGKAWRFAAAPDAPETILLNRFLSDSDPVIVKEAARAINDVPVPAAYPALAALISSPKSSRPGAGDELSANKSGAGGPESSARAAASADREPKRPVPARETRDAAEKRTPAGELKALTAEAAPNRRAAAPSSDAQVMVRIINANFRLGTSEAAQALARFAVDETAAEPMRVEALQALRRWAKPPARDRVTGLFQPIAPSVSARASSDTADAAKAELRSSEPAAAGLRPVLPQLLAAKSPVVVLAAIDAVAALRLQDAAPMLHAIVGDAKAAATIRARALETLGDLDDPALKEAIKTALTDNDAGLRITASTMLGQLEPDEAAKQLSAAFADAKIPQKKAILTALGDIKSTAADQALAEFLDTLAAEPAEGEGKSTSIPLEVQLELLEAAAKRSAPEVKAKLAAHEAAVAAGDALARFTPTLAGGDKAAGEKLFKEHAVAQCFRCHKVNGSGGDAGPDMTGIASKKDRRYLLESIVNPNAQIAEGFQSVIVTLKNGEMQMGVPREETATELTLQMTAPGLPPVTLKKNEIQARENGPSGMPPGMGELLTRRELRDILEYVASLK